MMNYNEVNTFPWAWQNIIYDVHVFYSFNVNVFLDGWSQCKWALQSAQAKSMKSIIFIHCDFMTRKPKAHANKNKIKLFWYVICPVAYLQYMKPAQKNLRVWKHLINCFLLFYILINHETSEIYIITLYTLLVF